MTEGRTVIGSLSAQAEMAKAQRTVMFTEIKELREETTKLIVMVGGMAKDIEEMQHDVDEFKALKQRGIGVIAVVGLGGGGVGAAVAAFGGRLLE